MNSNVLRNNVIGSLIRNQLKSLNVLSSRKFSVSERQSMRYVQFKHKTGGLPQLGAQIEPEGDIFNLSAFDSTIPNSLVKFLQAGTELQKKAQRIVGQGKCVVDLKDVTLLSPITNPDKVACVGLNYKGHCDEQNKPYPEEPMIFSKFSSVITGPYDNIELPKISQRVDWEVELAVIIGKKAKHLRPDQAQDVIFGYTVAQDVSARDWQKRNNGQFLLGKSMDTFCPLGPTVITKERINVDNLAIKCWVNGVLKQSGNTNELVFKPDFLVSHLSQFVTLYPGDVILTGTPGGVGMYRNPPEYLCKGDVVESEIEGIGRLKNKCV